jgi:hypothetical protein
LQNKGINQLGSPFQTSSHLVILEKIEYGIVNMIPILVGHVFDFSIFYLKIQFSSICYHIFIWMVLDLVIPSFTSLGRNQTSDAVPMNPSQASPKHWKTPHGRCGRRSSVATCGVRASNVKNTSVCRWEVIMGWEIE